jgi:hypothetical protein
MSVNTLLLVIGVLILPESNRRRQSRIKKVKGVLCYSRRGITILNLIKLGRELLVLINMPLAIVLLSNGASDPLIVLEV